MDKFYLNKKFCFITGAGGLLGYEHAVAILEADGNVIISDINKRKLESTRMKLQKLFPKKKIIKKIVDITNENSVTKCFLNLKKMKIFVHILINNASFNPSNEKLTHTLFEKYKLKKWRDELEVGITGAFICSKIFGSEMAKRKKGTIINVASDLSVIAPDQRLYNISKKFNSAKPVTYSVTKTALIGLTRYLATYWADKNVRSNAISPGGVYNNQKSTFVKKIKKLIPLNRMAKRSEYRSAIQFLSSDASSYMTGQNLIIDGGRSIW